MQGRFLRIFYNSVILIIQFILFILIFYIEDVSRKSFGARRYLINKKIHFERFWFSEDMVTVYLAILIFLAITFMLVIVVLWQDKYPRGDILTLLGCLGLTIFHIVILNSSQLMKLYSYYYINILLSIITLLQYLKAMILLKLYSNLKET